MLPHGIRRSLISMQFWSMFHDRDAIDPAVGDLVVDEFRRIYQSAGARYAFWTAARNIYLEAPFGRHGLLSAARRPAASGAVDVGQPRSAGTRRVRTPRRQVAARRAGRSRSTAADMFRRSNARSRPTPCWCRSSTRRSGPGSSRRADPTQTFALPDRRSRSRWHRQTSPTRPSATVTSGSPEDVETEQPRPSLLSRLRARARRPGPARDPPGRPGRARSGLHPRAAAADVADREHLVPRRGARPGQHPRVRPRAAGRQPLRRQHDAGHDHLHARLQHVLRRRAALLPARPQPRAVDADAGIASQVRHGRRLAARTPRRRSSPAPRCWSIPAATTRYTAPPGSATASTSAIARASSAWRSSRTSRSSRSSRSEARRPRCSSPGASGSRVCWRSTGCSASRCCRSRWRSPGG